MDQYDLFGNKIEETAKPVKKPKPAPKVIVEKEEKIVELQVEKDAPLAAEPMTRVIETVVDNVPETAPTNKVDEKELTKVYYTISEVAKMFDVNASLLRFWEKEFKQLGKIKKNKKGDRYYNKMNIRALNIIYYLLKVQKMTIAGAREMMKNKRKSTIAQFDVVENLQTIKSFLVDLKSSLQEEK